jgi:hypothetical protein
MNFFQRIVSFFRKPKEVQPAVVVLAPRAPEPVVPPVQTPTVAPAQVSKEPTQYVIHGHTVVKNTDGPFTGTYSIEGTTLTYATLTEAMNAARSLRNDEEKERDNRELADRLASLQPGQIDFLSLSADEQEIVIAFPHIFSGKVGPWSRIAEAVNWMQRQGGQPTPQLQARYGDGSDGAQSFAYGHWVNDWSSYQGPLRQVLDETFNPR